MAEIINAFPGYEFKDGKNMYRGEDVGFGGYVYSEPGMYTNVITFDLLSAHPSSMIRMGIFGPRYTRQLENLFNLRAAIKHKDFDTARNMFDGALAPYLNDEASAKSLAQALKIAINSIYGLTSASFDNQFRDKRNINNIVALRAALFMVTLRDELQERGFKVVHIKTDSIKVENPTREISDFIFDFGKRYGYGFEIEHRFERFCLVNDAVYIAKCAQDDPESPGEWTATGTQFRVPYVFKTLFSHDPIEFRDLCETKTVTSALYLDMNEGMAEDEHNYIFVGRAGSFCPMKPGAGGGLLMREKEGKYSYATGAKGWRWMESEMVEKLNKQNEIDRDYWNAMVDAAVKTISEFGDFEMFTAD